MYTAVCTMSLQMSVDF